MKARDRRHRRVRKRIAGTPERPRLCVYRSLRAIYVQVVDDESGRTLVQANSREPGLLPEGAFPGISAAAETIGKVVGERAKAAGITQVVFDRGGNLYHGRVKAVAEGARAGGLEF
jgi:large subunit ribosomal protein L18